MKIKFTLKYLKSITYIKIIQKLTIYSFINLTPPVFYKINNKGISPFLFHV